MNIKAIQNRDIDLLNQLQPEGWEDIRPYFYYYISSAWCDPIKITDGTRIAAIGTSIKHRNSAWLAHVIVHSDFRNQGMGNKLTTALVERLDPAKYQTIWLDATDMGYPVYKKIGFEIESEYIHLDGELVNLNLKNPASVIPFEEKYREDILQLDLKTSGESREAIFNEHFKSSLLYLSEDKVRGAYFPSFFERFIIADLPEAGTELMKLRVRVRNKARFPIENQAGINFLLENGHKQVRTSRRMRLGKAHLWEPENIFNRISGGLG